MDRSFLRMDPTSATSTTIFSGCLLDDNANPLTLFHWLLNNTVNPLTLFHWLPNHTVNPLTMARTTFAADTILQFVLLATWTCLNDTPLYQKNTLFAQFFTSQAVFETIASTVSIIFCPGLFEVLQAATPPPIQFFKSLPTPTHLSSKWGVYVIVMEKPGCRPRLNIGSATSASQGIRQRFQQYDLGLMSPRWVADALEKGYTITHKSPLCWMPKPTAALVPINRLLFVALEATFAYMFWAMRARTGKYGMAHICPCDPDTLEHDGLCSHCSLNERILGDFDLTAEQLEAQASEKEQKRLEMKAKNATNHHYKQMEENYDEYIGQAGLRKAKSRANNPGQDAHHQAKRVRKALDEKTFHCALCNISFTTRHSLQDHMKTPKHLRKSNESNNPFKCVHCNLGFHNQSNLIRHQRTQRHLRNLANAPSSLRLD